MNICLPTLYIKHHQLLFSWKILKNSLRRRWKKICPPRHLAGSSLENPLKWPSIPDDFPQRKHNLPRYRYFRWKKKHLLIAYFWRFRSLGKSKSIWENKHMIYIFPDGIYIYIYIHTYIHKLHYITLHYITLHYITLHYITLHTFSWESSDVRRWKASVGGSRENPSENLPVISRQNLPGISVVLLWDSHLISR